jgi:PAS domain S-box-containing protein
MPAFEPVRGACGDEECSRSTVTPTISASAAGPETSDDASLIAHERARLYEQLVESESRFRQLADNLPVGFVYQILLAVAGSVQFTYVSKAIESLLGVTREEVLADPTTLHRMIVDEDFPRVRSLEEESLAGRKPFDCQFRTRTRDGAVRWLHVRSAPRHLANGDTAWDGVAIDITDRVLMEEALREADRRKDEFLAMLAHELRNPLAPLQNALEVLRLQCAGESNLQRVGDIMERQVTHLVRLVDDLLDVSRITRGRVELRKEPVDLAEVATGAVEAVRPLIDTRRHQLIYEGPATPLFAHADAVRLTQVIGNLLNNAAKYTEPGGRITLSVSREQDQGLIRVRDTGVGIAPDMLQGIFELFTQVERTLDRSHGGLGIGLTLVRCLVELHGGTVEAQSEGIGKGSQFTVRMPLLDRAKYDRARSCRRDGSPPQRRILVVDDNVDAAETLALLLRLRGHEVRTAHSGEAAFSVVREFQPAVVLLDIGLPGIDGYKVAQQLRAEPVGECLLLCAITGYGQESDRTRSREAGFDHHFTKPLDLVAFEKLLETARRSERRRETGAPA